jgi:hypothetical protein
MGDQGLPAWPTELDFRTTVDGKAVELDVRETVSLIHGPKTYDVAYELKKLGWPIHYWKVDDFDRKIRDLPITQKLELTQKGLLRQDRDTEYLVPNWQVQTHLTRKQIFPAGKTITVEHSYLPVAGNSIGGMLSKQFRKRKDSGFADYAKAYCIDTAFLAGFDRKIAKQNEAAIARGEERDNGMYVERWLSYVLKSGANWKGPIKDFRLVIDKGKADNLVSFCMDGVKKISPTQFEVRKTNFEPQKNLSILIVEFYNPE